MIIGVLNCIGCILNIILEGSSIIDWMKFCAVLVFTLFAIAYYNIFKKRIKRGFLFGNTNFN